MFRRSALVLLAPCLALGFWRIVHAESPDEAAAVTKTIQTYQQAVAARDLDSIMSVWSTDPKIVMMGTGPGERWVGPADIKAAHRMILESFRKETYRPKWRSVSVMSDVAWAAGESVITDRRGGKPVPYWLNWTAVLEKQNGNWRMRQFHYSNLTGPDTGPSRRR
jgi:uncharacterized protein (TIGR02246 family)